VRRGSHDLLDGDAFETLLAYLDSDRERAGERYEALRRRIVQLLAWRGSWHPEELADLTLNRAAKSIRSGESIRSLEAYCAGIARLIAMEEVRNMREVPLLEEHVGLTAAASPVENDPRVAAFEDCLSEMAPADRNLILRYYCGDGSQKISNRKVLAQQLGIPLNALRIRACRIRAVLERHIQTRLGSYGKDA